MKMLPGLAGIITPHIVDLIDKGDINVIAMAEKCAILEIRYDLFAKKETWPSLAQKIRQKFAEATILGTVRLQKDGGQWPDAKAQERLNQWNEILSAPVIPQWIDVEWEFLNAWEKFLKDLAKQSVRVISSEHDFTTIPSWSHLEKAINLTKKMGLAGFKIAATSSEFGDAKILYDLIMKYSADFELFGAFAMGLTGRASRIYSLNLGANLSYASLGAEVAPGMLSVDTMLQALEQSADFASEIAVENFLKVQDKYVKN
ncbi:MAG: type I 3-dehydroquinate dehydratase [Fibrobacter sp.]|nr:type I 3-dehydroquinate dehydratase [Fibrobacter sp.]